MNSEPETYFYKKKIVGLFKTRTVFLKEFKNGEPIETDNPEEAKIFKGLHAIFNAQDTLLFTRWKAN